MTKFKSIFILLFCLPPLLSIGQLTSIDHWETVVFHTDTWHYAVGDSAPPTNWNQPNFTPNTWLTGAGGIGYADGDDNTIILPAISLFMRLDFNILDTAEIKALILHADYDDAFVAYLNGQEIARANIGTVGVPPSHTDVASTFSEAVVYQGQSPSSYILFQNDIDTLLRQGTNTLAIQVHNHSATSSDMSSIFLLSVGVTDTTMTYQPVPSWITVPPLFLGSKLPILKINTNGQTILEETKIMADMQIIDNGTGNLNRVDDAPNGYNNKIGIELRGASSLSFPKKGYGIETRDSLGDNNNVSLLGMPSENDWTLHGPYSDKTLLRNFVAYHIGNQLGRYNPKVRFCEVFLDNQYWGIYVLTEKIKRDKNRVDISKLSPTDTIGDDLTGGYIFKIDRDMGTDNGWFATSGYGYYAYHHPNAGDLHPSQKSYIQNYMNSFEAMMSSSNYNTPTGYRSWIDVPSFIDYMLMQEVTRNIDAYRLSAFMYKEKDSDGGKLHAGPIWDFNLGFGNEDFCDNGRYTSWAFNYNQVCGSPFPVFWSRLVNDSNFRDDFHCRWNELRSTVLNTDTIHHFIDSMVLELTDARLRNFERWDIIDTKIWPNFFVGQTYEDEIIFLKDWIQFRLNWIDNNMIGSAANCATSTEELDLAQNFKVYPNPFKAQLSFETTSDEPITVQLFDILGRNIQTVHLNANTSFYQINTSALTAGVYFYAVYNDNGRLVGNGKLVKGEE
jgi:hypothetical protein